MWLYQIRTNNKETQDWLLGKLKLTKYKVDDCILDGNFHTILLEDDYGGFRINYNYHDNYGNKTFGKCLDCANVADLNFIKT